MKRVNAGEISVLYQVRSQAAAHPEGNGTTILRYIDTVIRILVITK